MPAIENLARPNTPELSSQGSREGGMIAGTLDKPPTIYARWLRENKEVLRITPPDNAPLEPQEFSSGQSFFVDACEGDVTIGSVKIYFHNLQSRTYAAAFDQDSTRPEKQKTGKRLENGEFIMIYFDKTHGWQLSASDDNPYRFQYPPDLSRVYERDPETPNPDQTLYQPIGLLSLKRPQREGDTTRTCAVQTHDVYTPGQTITLRYRYENQDPKKAVKHALLQTVGESITKKIDPSLRERFTDTQFAALPFCERITYLREIQDTSWKPELRRSYPDLAKPEHADALSLAAVLYDLTKYHDGIIADTVIEDMIREFFLTPNGIKHLKQAAKDVTAHTSFREKDIKSMLIRAKEILAEIKLRRNDGTIDGDRVKHYSYKDGIKPIDMQEKKIIQSLVKAAEFNPRSKMGSIESEIRNTANALLKFYNDNDTLIVPHFIEGYRQGRTLFREDYLNAQGQLATNRPRPTSSRRY